MKYENLSNVSLIDAKLRLLRLQLEFHFCVLETHEEPIENVISELNCLADVQVTSRKRRG